MRPPKADAWKALAGPLGIADASEGQGVTAPADAPPLAGIVEQAGPREYPEALLVRIEKPAPGLAHVFALPMGGQVFLVVRLYLYGSGAAAVAAREETVWQSWMAARFPAAGGAQ